jgi:hypothetical protein
MRGEPNRFLQRWERHTAAVREGVLTYTVFPGGDGPFVGYTRLDGRPIAPSDAHRYLAAAGHEHAALKLLGEQPSPSLCISSRGTGWNSPAPAVQPTRGSTRSGSPR